MRPDPRRPARLARPARLGWLAAATALTALPGAVLAQDGTNQSVLSFSQKLEAADASGSALNLTSTTSLGFSVDRSTAGETVALDAGLGLIVTDLGGANDLSLGAPHLGLRYDRTMETSAFSAHLTYGRDRLERLRTLDEYLSETGGFSFPASPADLLASGTKESYDFGVTMELGRTAPFGVTLTAAADKASYSDSTDPLLLDNSSRSLGITGRFSYAPQGDVTLGLSTSWDSLEGRADSTSQSLTLGTSYDLSPVLSLSADATLTNTGGDSSTSLGLGLDYALLNGSISLDLGQDQARLAWDQKLVAGSVSASLSHGADQTGDGTLDQLNLGYNQTVSDVSSLGLGLFLSDTNAPTADVSGAELVANYSQQLTPDWGLNLGMNYRLRDTAGTTSKTAGVFVSISRNFSFGQ